LDHTKTLLELDVEHDDELDFTNDEFNLYVREDSAALQRSDEATGVSEKGRLSTPVVNMLCHYKKRLCPVLEMQIFVVTNDSLFCVVHE
jgi:hypothetical protein